MPESLVFLAGLYAGFSLVVFLAYAFDKWAAVKGRRRVSEKTLHLMAVFGGWPGALLARWLFRHKTSKRGFVALFWMTVLANLAVVTALVVLYRKLTAA